MAEQVGQLATPDFHPASSVFRMAQWLCGMARPSGYVAKMFRHMAKSAGHMAKAVFQTARRPRYMQKLPPENLLPPKNAGNAKALTRTINFQLSTLNRFQPQINTD